MSSSPKWIEGITPESSVEDAARRSLEPRLAAVVHLLPLAAYLASHDIEHVHRLRVATRRATAAQKLYRDCLPPKKYRWVKRWLRKIRRAAGDARDLDVLADRLTREYGERVAPVVDLVAKDRAAVQPAIVRVADCCRKNDRLIRKTATLLESIHRPEVEADAGEPTKFAIWAAEQFAMVAGEFVLAMPTESSDTVALHAFRIRAKALRYAIELVASAFDRELRKDLYPLIEDLQERLGRIQDHVAAAERSRNWAAQTRDEVLQETLRELAEAESRGLTDATREFHTWWSDEQVENVHRLLKPTPVATPLPEADHQTSLAD
jgi:CHAD domain-containing protein